MTRDINPWVVINSKSLNSGHCRQWMAMHSDKEWEEEGEMMGEEGGRE